MTSQRHIHRVYGATVVSDAPLPLPFHAEGDLALIELSQASDEMLRPAREAACSDPEYGDWFRYAFLPGGSAYVGWDGVGEFLVSAEGSRVCCLRHQHATSESFQVYLLGQALSYALVQQGLEPLHATAVEIDGVAVAFLGTSGMGKSSLASCFVGAGHRLLTDDVLIIRERKGELLAYPGPPRLKLFPEIAEAFLGAAAGEPMNQGTNKLILPLAARQACDKAIPLAAIYQLAEPEDVVSPDITIHEPPPRDAFLALIGNTFNRRLTSPERLQRQFHAATQLVAAGIVRTLTYPRILTTLPAVTTAVLADANTLARGVAA